MPSTDARTSLGNVVLISPEPWNEVWRRNQHLASRLPVLGLADHVTFVNPSGRSRAPDYSPAPGVTVISPRRLIPKRLGGLRIVAASLRWKVTRNADTLWINDPTTGVWLSRHSCVAYDVTDDWRSARSTPRERKRLVAAEDRLAVHSRTVVCSDELQKRWKQRYGVDATVVQNAVDLASIRQARPMKLRGQGPHAGYVGTLHDERLDVAKVLKTAELSEVGQVHLVGPDCLGSNSRDRLRANPKIILHGSVPANDVPSWLTAFDVLICPHVVNQFTLSLDAIKLYEYLATDRPVVATPTSGFQHLRAPGVFVKADEFADTVSSVILHRESFKRDVPDWDTRAFQFAAALAGPVAHD